MTVRSHPGPPDRVSARRLSVRRLDAIALPAFVLALLLLAIFLSDRFLSINNLLTILTDAAVVRILAIGMTCVLIVAGIDLSVGAVVTMTTVLLGVALKTLALSVPLAIAFVLAAGALIGFVNGLIVVCLRVPPIIATLATMTVLGSLAFLITEGAISSLRRFTVLTFLGQGRFGGMPVPALILVLLAAACHVVLARTVVGTRLRAIGGNRSASTLMGLAVERYTVAVYVIAGLLASVAGLIVAGRTAAASAQAGNGLELSAVTAAVLGGTSLTGGQGSVAGTLVGALALSVLFNVLVHAGVPFFWQLVATGLALIAAVALNTLIGRRD